MNDEPQVQLRTEWLRLFPSDTNTVFIEIETKYDEILRDSTAGHQTLTSRSVRVSPSLRISFNLHSSNPHPIQSLLSTQLVNYPNWLCNQLASEISTEATNLGFVYNSFNLTMTVTVTYRTLVLPGPSSSNHEGSLRTNMLRMVLLGLMKEKEFKSLKMETESCSICLEKFSVTLEGVDAEDVKIISDSGIKSFNQLWFLNEKSISAIEGISESKASKIWEAVLMTYHSLKAQKCTIRASKGGSIYDDCEASPTPSSPASTVKNHPSRFW